MAMKKMARVNPGLRGLDVSVVSEDLTLTKKTWTPVSAAVAKELLESEHKGRPMYEVTEAGADDAPAETASAGESA